MKRCVVLLVVALMLFSCVARAQSGVDLSSLTPEELQQLISAAETQLQLTDETMLQSAVDVLTNHWKNEIYADPTLDGTSGYFEILAAQATYIKRDFAVQDEYASASDALFENVYCVVDFVILSDYFDTAPYYWDAGIDNCVVVYRDGSMEVSRQSLFNQYRARTYSNDFSAIIDRVERFDVGESAIYHLTDE
ncbi:MAG: hypothetical protein Q4E72_06985 [bacterium]|nr:hypothetical protein [bacterium]